MILVSFRFFRDENLNKLNENKTFIVKLARYE